MCGGGEVLLERLLRLAGLADERVGRGHALGADRRSEHDRKHHEHEPADGTDFLCRALQPPTRAAIPPWCPLRNISTPGSIARNMRSR